MMFHIKMMKFGALCRQYGTWPFLTKHYPPKWQSSLKKVLQMLWRLCACSAVQRSMSRKVTEFTLIDSTSKAKLPARCFICWKQALEFWRHSALTMTKMAPLNLQYFTTPKVSNLLGSANIHSSAIAKKAASESSPENFNSMPVPTQTCHTLCGKWSDFTNWYVNKRSMTLLPKRRPSTSSNLEPCSRSSSRVPDMK